MNEYKKTNKLNNINIKLGNVSQSIQYCKDQNVNQDFVLLVRSAVYFLNDF